MGTEPPQSQWIGRTMGNYVIRSPIGKGGMGMVYAGEHRFLGDRVAIKVLHATFANDPTVARRFFDEARTTRGINHPNIVRILDFGQTETDGVLYLVMELLEGQSLGRAINTQGPLGDLTTSYVGAAVADALAAAHERGVVHRDLKPDNIFLCSDQQVKVVDFGLAKLLARLDQTAAGIVLGTPQYIAPEQVKKSKQVGPHTDIYALGVVLFKMLCGRLPFDADDITEMISQHLFMPPPRPSTIVSVAPELEEIVLQCLAKEPDQRPRSMSELRDRLTQVATGPVFDQHDVEPAQQTIVTGGGPSTRMPWGWPQMTGSPTTAGVVGPDGSGAREESMVEISVVAEPSTASSGLGEVVPRERTPQPPAAAAAAAAVDHDATLVQTGSPIAPSSGVRGKVLAVAALLALALGAAALYTLYRNRSAGGATATIPAPTTTSSPAPPEPMAPPSAPMPSAPSPDNSKMAAPAPTDPKMPDEALKPPAVANTPPAPSPPVEKSAPGSEPNVVILSEPAGARVIVDDTDRGVTPAKLFLQGTHELTVSLSGYRTVRQSIRKPGVIELRLEKAARKATTKGKKGWKPREGLE